MFGISLAELLIVLIIVIFFVKPKDLPEIAHNLGRIYAKIKNIVANLKEELDKHQKEIGLDEVKKEFNSGLVSEEIDAKEEKTEIVDIYGNVHKVDKIDEIRSDLTKEELESEIQKYNEANQKSD